MATEELSQREVADRLGVTVRTVARLIDDGVLTRTYPEKGFPRYPWPENRDLFKAYERRKLERDTQTKEAGSPAARKLEAEARFAELKLAEMEGRLIPLEVLEEALTDALDRLQSRILDIPGSWAPDLLGIKTIREGVTRLRPKMSELLEALRRGGEADE